MSNPDIASAFGRDGIEPIPIARRPLKSTVGRQRFPIRDLRSQPGDAETERLLANDVAWLSSLYRQGDDLPLRDFSLLQTSGEVFVMRGLVWHDGVPIEGTLPPKQLRKGDNIAQWTERMERSAHRAQFFPGTSAIIHAAGSRNYYHWTVEIMPRLFALREAMRSGQVRPDRILLFYDEPLRFVGESITALLPEMADRVEITRDVVTRLERCCFFIDATAEGPYENHLAHTSRLKACTGFLAEAIDERHARRPLQGRGRALLISRADAPTRRLLHEEQLIEALADIGLERVTLTGMPVREQMNLMADARLVIAPHGAGLTNTIHCRPGTAVIELNVPAFVRRCRSFADIAMYRGLHYGLVVADPMPSDNEEPDIALQGPRALKALRKLADKLLAGAEAPAAGQSIRSTLATDGTPDASSANSM